MKKQALINLLNSQKALTKKSTRQDIVEFVMRLVNYHIKDNADINGISPTRNGIGVNLGEVVEVVAKSSFRNKLEKSASSKHYDMQVQGEKVEVKFSSSDAYAHPINPTEKVAWYMLITYTKGEGLQVFKVPYSQRHLIRVNAQGRIYTNQQAKFLDKDLTDRLTPRG